MSDKIFLASRSPRRQAFLAALGVAFKVAEAGIDETPLPGEVAGDMVVRLSRAKAFAVATRAGCHATVLAADTVVALNEVLLGKPADIEEATAMLRALRGRTHQVHTAVSLAYQGRLETRLSTSQVTMRNYTDDEITTYVASGDPLDKAGGYAIQHSDFTPVAEWTGCYSSIMGFPLGVVAGLLAEAGTIGRVDVATLCEGFGGRCCLRSIP